MIYNMDDFDEFVESDEIINKLNKVKYNNYDNYLNYWFQSSKIQLQNLIEFIGKWFLFDFS